MKMNDLVPGPGQPPRTRFSPPDPDNLPDKAKI